jgi:hypothetical protein
MGLRNKMIRIKYEVWFQYNKQGKWIFTKLEDAKKFARAYKKNKPIVYSLVSDRPLKFKYGVKK